MVFSYLGKWQLYQKYSSKSLIDLAVESQCLKIASFLLNIEDLKAFFPVNSELFFLRIAKIRGNLCFLKVFEVKKITSSTEKARNINFLRQKKLLKLTKEEIKEINQSWELLFGYFGEMIRENVGSLHAKIRGLLRQNEGIEGVLGDWEAFKEILLCRVIQNKRRTVKFYVDGLFFKLFEVLELKMV